MSELFLALFGVNLNRIELEAALSMASYYSDRFRSAKTVSYALRRIIDLRAAKGRQLTPCRRTQRGSAGYFLILVP
jgi:hypothetical protein